VCMSVGWESINNVAGKNKPKKIEIYKSN
jgi:hypothetical protein